MLPAGAAASSFWLKDLENTIGPPLELLLDAALVQPYPSGSEERRYTIHPVIRDYVLKNHCSNDVLVKLLQLARAFLETNNYSIGEVGFEERKRLSENVRTEEKNLEAVLLIPSEVDDIAHLQALISLANHYTWTSPRLEVAERAVSLAETAKKPLLQAHALFAMGKNLHLLDRYQEARQHFKRARELFIEQSSFSRGADCLIEIQYELGYSGEGSFQEKMDITKQAQDEYQSAGDEIGVGRSFRYRGRLLYQTSNEENHRLVESREALEEACKRLANSPYSLGICYYHQMCLNFLGGDFQAADRCAQSAIESLSEFGSVFEQARLFCSIGEGHYRCGHFESALDYFNKAIDINTECRSSRGLAVCWIGVSRAFIKMGDMGRAAKSIEEARKYSLLLPDEKGKTKRFECDTLQKELVEAQEMLTQKLAPIATLRVDSDA